MEFDSKGWKYPKGDPPQKTEDNLLYQYCLKHGGVTYSEVWLGKEIFGAHRRIDGIRFPSSHGRRKILTYKRSDDRQFKSEVRRITQGRGRIEIIEVKRKSDRSVFGQIAVGAWLLQHELKVPQRKMQRDMRKSSSRIEIYLSKARHQAVGACYTQEACIAAKCP